MRAPCRRSTRRSHAAIGAVKEDFAFHRAIADATDNPHFAQFLDFLGRYVIPRHSIRMTPGTPAEQHSLSGAHPEGAPTDRRRHQGARSEARARHARRTCRKVSSATASLRFGRASPDRARRHAGATDERSMSMKRVLLTGAAGDIGRRLRTLLQPIYPELRLSDIKTPADLRRRRELRRGRPCAIWTRSSGSSQACEGIIHLGGHSVEGSWETILNANIIGCHNLFEAARRQGVQARGVRLIEPCRRLLPAPPAHRHRRHRAARLALRREQGVRRGAWARSMPTNTACACCACGSATSATSRSTSAGCRSGSSRRTSCSCPHRPRASRPRSSRSSTAPRSMNAPGGTTAAPTPIGYRPTGRAEDFREQAMAEQAKLAADPVGDYYQGGTFCAQEFAGDRRKVWK